MDAIWQTIFSSAFSWRNCLNSDLNYTKGLWVQFTIFIFKHRFRKSFGTFQATSHNPNQWWSVCRRIYASIDINEFYVYDQSKKLSCHWICQTKNHRMSCVIMVMRLICNILVMWLIPNSLYLYKYDHYYHINKKMNRWFMWCNYAFMTLSPIVSPDKLVPRKTII